MHFVGRTARKTLIALVTLLGMFLAATPAHAEICDSYSETFSAAEIATFREKLRNAMPARDAALIDRTLIVNSPADTSRDAGAASLLPSVRFPPEGPAIIRIPPGLHRLICLSVHWTSHITQVPEADMLGTVTIFVVYLNNCLAQRSEAFCFQGMMRGELYFLGLGWTTHRMTDAQYQDRIDSTIFYLIAHELGHVIGNAEQRTGSGSRRSDRVGQFSENEELRADYLAQRAMILTGQDFRAGSFIMIPLAMLQDRPDSRPTNDGHPQHRCRATLVMRIGDRLAPEIAVGYGWAIRLPSAPPDPRRSADGLRATADRLRDEIHIGRNFGQTEAATCPRLSLNRIEALKSDYDALLAAIDAAGGEAGASGADGLTTLSAYQPATDEVRAMLGTFILYRLTLIESDAARRGDVATRRRLAPIFAALRARFDLNEVSAVARGWMLLYGTMNTYDLAPAGTRIDLIARATDLALREAAQYLPDPENWPLLQWHLAQMAVLQRNCADASQRFERVARSDVQEARLAGQVGEILRTADAATCARVSEMARSELRTTRGWQ